MACILALDQGTTSSRAIIFDENQNILGRAQRPFAGAREGPFERGDRVADERGERHVRGGSEGEGG